MFFFQNNNHQEVTKKPFDIVYSRGVALVNENFPDVITGYQTPPLIKLPFPCLALASLDDPYSSLGRTKYFVEKWGCELITIGKKGHVNIDSGLGDWPQGKNLIINFQNSLYAKL